MKTKHLFISILAVFITHNAVAEGPVHLNTFVAAVLENNPELELYEAEIAVAKGGRKQAGIYPNPKLSTSLGQRSVSMGGLSDEGVAWSASLVQTFDFPGRRELRKAIANENIRLAELGLNQYRAALDAEANIIGFKLLAAQRKAEATTEVAERLRELSEVMVQRDPAGVTPLIEIRIIKAAAISFRKQAIEASQELQSALFQANILRGQPIAMPLKIRATAIELPEPSKETDFLFAAAKNNFRLKMRQAELEQQGLRIELSEKQRWPAISVGPFVEQAKGGDDETIAGIGISLPLPVWNSNKGNIAIERSRRAQAETSLFLTRREVEMEVLEQLLAYRLRLRELTEWGEDAIKEFQETAQLGDRHYRLGALPIATYMELQREYLAALNAIVELQAEAVESREKLEVATGLSARANWTPQEPMQ